MGDMMWFIEVVKGAGDAGSLIVEIRLVEETVVVLMLMPLFIRQLGLVFLWRSDSTPCMYSNKIEVFSHRSTDPLLL